MPDFGKIEFLLTIAALSSIGVIDMINRWKNGHAYRELRKLKDPSRMTVTLLNECSRFLKPLWWHWAMLCILIFSLLGLAIDTD
jgi:hypothetical protein